MGSSISRWIYRDKETTIMAVGLDYAGKTTMLYKLKMGEIETITPTIGFTIEQTRWKGLKLMSLDTGGRSVIRPLYRHYYQLVDGFVLVVDSSEHNRTNDVKATLRDILEYTENMQTPLLIMANKQDLPGALTPEQLTDELQLTNIKDRPWRIVPCSMMSGTGVTKGLDWLVEKITGKIVKIDIEESLKTSGKDIETITSVGGLGTLFSKGRTLLP